MPLNRTGKKTAATGSGKYIFFIGGTGARVCRAFLHSCAAGAVKDDAIRFMLLDADTSNAACIDCEELYHLYRHQYEVFHQAHRKSRKKSVVEAAFHCNATMYHEKVVSPVEANSRRLGLVVPAQHRNGRSALSWFYDDTEQNQDLLNGFYAHPNIGCIFFQNFNGKSNGEDSGAEEPNALFRSCLADIANDLRSGDVRVAIVGSLFGGTGAAGIPTVMKVVREYCEANAPQHIARLHFGGVLLAPYFKIPSKGNRTDGQEQNISIESDTFLSTTRAALFYYQFQDFFDRIYLLGKEEPDLICPEYEDGGTEQRNKAHVVELLSVMAVKDYLTEGKICRDPRDKVQVLMLSPMQSQDDLQNRLDWNSECFDRDFWALADMLRVQMLLETEIYPYVEKKGEGALGMYQWYKAYGMDDYDLEQDDDDLSRMRRYSEDFLEWMYDLQYRYIDSGISQMEREPSIALCGSVMEDVRESIDRRLNPDEHMDEPPPDIEEILTKFNTVVEAAQNMGYLAGKAFTILSALGVVPQATAALQLPGLFRQLFDLVRDKKIVK